jgi:hypothetical protein
MPLEGEIENLCHCSIGQMPSDRNLLSLDASLAIPTRVSSALKPTGQTSLELLHLRLRFFDLGLVDQPRNPVVFW